jgi:hypothetical protein
MSGQQVRAAYSGLMNQVRGLAKLGQINYLALVNPPLVGLIAVTSLYAANVDEAPITIAALALLWSIVGTAIVMTVLRLVMRDFVTAGFVSTIWLTLFFLYGYLFDSISGATIDGFLIGRFRYLLAAEIAVALLALSVAFRARNLCQRSTPVITVVLLVFLVLNIGSAVGYHLSGPNDASSEIEDLNLIPLPLINRDQLPDIYYIILDSYPRADVLEDLYGFDNSEFLDHLEEMGFYVASDSRTNYVQTSLSLASSLNMGYLQQLIGAKARETTRISVVQGLVQHNKVALLAKRMGYRFAFLRSNWILTLSNPNADEELSRIEYPWGAFGRLILQPVFGAEFGHVFARSTMLRQFVDKGVTVFAADLFNEKIERLKQISEVDDPTFTFAHFAPPHPPYVFDREGNSLSFGFSSGSFWDRTLYVEQLIWVNKSIQAAIDRIIQNDDGRSVIIIQGDHGTELTDERHVVAYGGDPDETLIFERSNILNAYRLPNSCDSQGLYQSITPVNTFRLVFDGCLGTEFGLLEDNTYWSSYIQPYDFRHIEEFGQTGETP